MKSLEVPSGCTQGLETWQTEYPVNAKENSLGRKVCGKDSTRAKLYALNVSWFQLPYGNLLQDLLTRHPLSIGLEG